MPEDRVGIPTQPVKLGECLRMNLPLGWSHERRDDGCWWCGPSDGHVGVLIREARSVALKPSEARPATPTGNALHEVEEISTYLRTLDLVGEIEVSRIQSGRIVHARNVYREDGEELIDVRWYVIKGRSTSVALFSIILILARDRYEDEETQSLIDHFATEAFACQILVKRRPGENNIVPLQDLYLDSITAIQIPAYWRVSEVHGGLRAYDPTGLPGEFYTYWDFYDVTESREPGHEDVLRQAKRLAKKVATDGLFDDGTLVERSLAPAAFGTIAYVVEDLPGVADLANGAPVRAFSWCYTMPAGDTILMTRFRLYQPRHLLDQPGLRQIRELIDREVRAQRLLPLTGE